MPKIDETEFDYEKELEVDIYNLDQEIKEQPIKFCKYSILLADQDRAVRIAKENLDQIEAQIDFEVRSSAETKITEAAIKNRITLHPAVIQANEEYIKEIHTKNVIESAVKAFDQRKSGLDNLVKLHTQQYYAEPKEEVMAVAASQEAKKSEFKKRVKSVLKRNNND